MTNLDSILKSRDITLSTKVCLVLDYKEIQPVHLKGDQSWVFIGWTDAETETQILWPPDTKNWLIGKDPDAGKDWRLEEKGMTEDEMVGWHHQCDDMSLSKLWELVMDTGRPGVLQYMEAQRVGHTEQRNWTELDGLPWKRTEIILPFLRLHPSTAFQTLS